MHHQPFSKLRGSDVQSSLLSGVHNTLTQLKVPHSSSELFVKRASLTMILNNGDQRTTPVNQSKIAAVLGVHRRNIAAASSRLEMKDEDEVLPLSACQRQLPLHTSITSETRDFVTAFWKSKTRVSPNKKDICKHRIEAKCVIKHPIHLLDDSQVTFFLQCNPWWPWLLCTKFIVFAQHTRLAVQYQIDSFLPAITLGQTVPIWYFLGNNHCRYQFRAP